MSCKESSAADFKNFICIHYQQVSPLRISGVILRDILRSKVQINPKNLVNCISFQGWLVGRLMSPFSTKIGYFGDHILGGDSVLPGYGWPMIQ